ncbi:helix-turn-helix transcriptional regulator [Paenibacillus campinasensis]|uniref:Transcriptional regulator n=1 Tax=Paenibacillus campinasensis TaxID=66347 RepID=A0A268EJZ8_9BACL|nr:YafY family protein [Paenibacillus campinasensis]PAD73440.1 transcriptional regulator [Paenibacillus campinasensis]
MRADRLLSILFMLQNGGKKTTKYLAEQLEVSERTIIRDMESLSMAGIPVYAERGAAGGWLLEESYRTNLTGMTPEELLTLLLSGQSQLMEELGIGKQLDAAYQKLLAASPRSVRQDAEMIRQKVHIDGAGWHSFHEPLPCLPVVQEAVWADRQLSFRYHKGEELVERHVSPLGLVAKRSTWYLVAESAGELRTYRISRMVDASISDELCTRPPGFDLAAYWEHSVQQFKQQLPRYPAMVRLTTGQLSRLQRERYIHTIRHDSSGEMPGWTVAHMEFNTLESAVFIVLGCGPEAEVLQPPELREQVSATAKAIWQVYAPSPSHHNAEEI